MREPPSGPCEHDWIATGFSLNGWSFMRDTQSIAFFSAPGIVQLYSGETMITPSAARIAAASSSAAGGKPEASCMSALYIGSLSKAGADFELHARRRELRQRARQRRVVGALAQRAADHEHVH